MSDDKKPSRWARMLSFVYAVIFAAKGGPK